MTTLNIPDHYIVALYDCFSGGPILVKMPILGCLVKFANPTVFYISLSFDMQELYILRVFCIF